MPKTLDDGEKVEVQGSSSTYELIRQGTVYSCSCPAWRNQGAQIGFRTCKHLRAYLGDEFTAKDFRTWGGTLIAAIALAEHGVVEEETEAKRVITAVMRRVGEELGNTPAVARASYVSPAVIDQYLDGTTIEDFRPPHLRVVGARDLGLDLEEQALLSLLRSWRIKQAREAA